jgi:hypothetical protein
MELIQNKKFITLYILATFITLVFFYSYAIASVDTYPTQDWKIFTPEMQGMHSQMLTEMMEHIEKNNFNIDSLLIVRNGYMVFDAYFYPFSNDQKHHIYSCTKSIMSALIGIAIDIGYIQFEYPLGSRKEAIRYRGQVMGMRTPGNIFFLPMLLISLMA